jgi:hypothetical protein
MEKEIKKDLKELVKALHVKSIIESDIQSSFLSDVIGLALDVSEDVEESSIFAKHMINFIDEVNLMKGNTPLLEYLNESYSYSPN